MLTLKRSGLSISFFNEHILRFIEDENLTEQAYQDFLEEITLICLMCLTKNQGSERVELLIDEMKKSIELSLNFYESETKQ